MEEKYNSGLISQSFWFVEFKKIVLLYDSGADHTEIKRQCIEENLFGAINPYREKRMCGYLLTRLKSMDERLIKIFVNSDIATQKIINIITVMNTNRLFFEFLYEVYRNKLIINDKYLENKDVDVFFTQKENQSENIYAWKDATKKRLGSLLPNFLLEADMLRMDKGEKNKRTINRVFISMELESYLKDKYPSIYKAIMGVN